MLFNEEPTKTNTPTAIAEPRYGVDFMRGLLVVAGPCALFWGLVAFGITNLPL